MSASSDLKAVFTETIPLVERWIDLRDEFAALRDAATAKGLDWGQIKALAKAHVEDAAAGETKRVARIIEKADFASSYAEMLRLQPDVIEVESEWIAPNLNENNSVSGVVTNSEGISPDAYSHNAFGPVTKPEEITPHDPVTGEVIDASDGDDQSSVHHRKAAPARPAEDMPANNLPLEHGLETIGQNTKRAAADNTAAAHLSPPSDDDWQCPPPPDFLLRRAS